MGRAEEQIHVKWLSFPRSEIHIAELLTIVQTLPATLKLEEKVAATIKPEQKKIFTLFVRAKENPTLL